MVLGFALFLAATAAEPSPALMTAANGFTACLTATVRMGMTMKMDPAVFAQGFEKSCLQEQQAFFDEAVKFEMASGKSKDEAAKQINAQIAEGRRIFAANQASYIATGKVPN